MGKTIKPEQLAKEVMDGLEEYAELAADVMKKEIQETGKVVNGIEADKAANSLKTGLARLISPAKEGYEAMKQLGIEVTNADGSMKDSITIQRELHEAFGKLSESEQIAAASAIFGKNQMAPWLALINTAPEDPAALKWLEEGKLDHES